MGDHFSWMPINVLKLARDLNGTLQLAEKKLNLKLSALFLNEMKWMLYASGSFFSLYSRVCICGHQAQTSGWPTALPPPPHQHKKGIIVYDPWTQGCPRFFVAGELLLKWPSFSFIYFKYTLNSYISRSFIWTMWHGKWNHGLGHPCPWGLCNLVLT